MKVAELLNRRRENWIELEKLCRQLENKRKSKLTAQQVSTFAALYRSACADLALANAYQLPPSTVDYLHKLVGRAHNQLHRSRSFAVGTFLHVVFTEVPQRIFNDRCVQFVFVVFWTLFLVSAYLAYHDSIWPGFGEAVVGETQIEQMSTSFENFDERPWEINFSMACFYIYNNTSIGLQCFATSLLVLPGLVTLSFNSVFLGASFGIMFRPEMGEAGENFKNFVTAHGPFELTAIVLSGGAGLRLGLAWLMTGGLTRTASLKLHGRAAMPLLWTIIVLFFLAAMIEGFISPTSLPWAFKAFVALLTSGMLMFYFVILGFPRGGLRATR